MPGSVTRRAREAPLARQSSPSWARPPGWKRTRMREPGGDWSCGEGATIKGSPDDGYESAVCDGRVPGDARVTEPAREADDDAVVHFGDGGVGFEVEDVVGPERVEDELRGPQSCARG